MKKLTTAAIAAIAVVFLTPALAHAGTIRGTVAAKQATTSLFRLRRCCAARARRRLWSSAGRFLTVIVTGPAARLGCIMEP